MQLTYKFVWLAVALEAYGVATASALPALPVRQVSLVDRGEYGTKVDGIGLFTRDDVNNMYATHGHGHDVEMRTFHGHGHSHGPHGYDDDVKQGATPLQKAGGIINNVRSFVGNAFFPQKKDSKAKASEFEMGPP